MSIAVIKLHSVLECTVDWYSAH